METRVHYDPEYDNLIISQKAPDEKVKKNFMFDDFIISLTGKGKIVSIEILGVSKFLKEMGFNANLLENIASARLIITPKKDFLFIGFQIISKNSADQQRVPIANIPIACMH